MREQRKGRKRGDKEGYRRKKGMNDRDRNRMGRKVEKKATFCVMVVTNSKDLIITKNNFLSSR